MYVSMYVSMFVSMYVKYVSTFVCKCAVSVYMMHVYVCIFGCIPVRGHVYAHVFRYV